MKEGANTERLQKYLSQSGVASRRQAEVMIRQGRVMVNGQVVTALGSKVHPHDVVCVDGKRVKPVARKIYLMLYKPRGYVTTLFDPQGRRTVADLIKGVRERVFPVGRLDYDTEGLLLLTNDGEVAFALTHPRHKVAKTYQALVDGLPTQQVLDQLRHGVDLEDGRTAPAEVKVLRHEPTNNQTWVEITIYEGRNRQIRRMFATVGHPVRRLKRTRVAFLHLGRLRRGQFRPLTAGEVRELQKIAAAVRR